MSITEFPADDGSRALMKIYLSIPMKRVGATQVVELVLHDQISDHGRLLCWGLRSREPGFNCWDEVICIDLFYL